jgi:hypothetical protein
MSAANIAATLGDTARDAAAGWFTEGRRVRIALPPAPNTDFNDNKARDHVAGARITAAPPRSATQVASPRRPTAWTTLPSSVVRGHRWGALSRTARQFE